MTTQSARRDARIVRDTGADVGELIAASLEPIDVSAGPTQSPARP